MSNILIVNDDGVHSIGLLILKKELEKIGNVTVITPKERASGTGKALTFYDVIRMEKVKLSDGTEAYAIKGTPSDAVMLGIYKLLEKPPDVIVSGINLGNNMNIDDILSSGTLGAAFEAAIHSVPAIAISSFVPAVPSLSDEGVVSMKELNLSAKLTRKIVEYVLEQGMPEDVDVISVNVPEKAVADKIKLTNISYLGYEDIYFKQDDGYVVKCNGGRFPDADPDTDVYAVLKDRSISITPIKLRFHHKIAKAQALLDFLKIKK
jgi:5'-nucleotidase